MSELLCCDHCGELSIYEYTIYVHDKPICPTCHTKAFDRLKIRSYTIIKKNDYLSTKKIREKG